MSGGLPRVPLSLGVTGHRDLVEAEIPAIEARLRELFDLLEIRYPDTPLRLITPLAEGGDRVAAQVARERDIDLVVPLPLPVDDYEQDFADADSRQSFHELLAGSTVVDVHAARVHDQGDRDQAYAQAGIYCVDHCQILIAVWDGKPAEEGGGTADVVEYHQFGDMARLGLDPSERRGLAKDDTDLVYHIVCSRNRDDGAPAENLRPGSARWLIADPDRKTVDDIPPNLNRMIERTGEFNRDVAKVTDPVSPAAVLPGWQDKLAGHRDLARTAGYFALADHLATRNAWRYRIALRVLYVLAALMGIAFIAYADLNRPEMIAAYLVLFFVGFVLYRVVSRLQWHRKFLDYRALAEGLRVQFYWRQAGVSGQIRNDFAYDNFLQKQDIEIGWIRNVMRFAGAPEDFQARRAGDVDDVIEHWIGRPGGSGQLGYFEARCRSHRRHVAQTDRLVAITLWAGIVITVALALFQHRLTDVALTGMVAAMGMLPLLAAVREAYAHKVAEKELLKQYSFMLDIYRMARFRLSRCTTANQKRDLLRALGEAALDEHAEWILVHRERPLEPGKL
ncbi:hypothetical protein G4Y73_08975 [Wenzhouxiangella sp. XN201]|uniref:hypothetical protein n=1 Tax=Wenzhouxiangella sp. XN201 TaxID=2710755 RepID=UPI0013C7C888|nr:hypothetical protein [Wenzhouxiangella sp. XN201]NEZ04275.1 hypothetical protein [Wenzhouxiangella sp. XN201]